jgi:hypothetical protein
MANSSRPGVTTPSPHNPHISPLAETTVSLDRYHHIIISTMTRSLLSIFLLGLFLVLPWGARLSAENAQPSAAEAKLREALRNTMLQLRSAENEKATMQAAQQESDEKVKDLTGKLEATAKQMAADKDAADKAIAEMKGKIAERDKILAGVREELERLKEDDTHTKKDLATTADQRAKLQEQVNALNLRVADQQRKNEGMFKVANEILSRYEKFGLGDALSAREPFTGITRVKLQSLFEEYQDSLSDHKIKPPEHTGTPAATAAAPPKTAKARATPKPKS